MGITDEQIQLLVNYYESETGNADFENFKAWMKEHGYEMNKGATNERFSKIDSKTDAIEYAKTMRRNGQNVRLIGLVPTSPTKLERITLQPSAVTDPTQEGAGMENVTEVATPLTNTSTESEQASSPSKTRKSNKYLENLHLSILRTTDKQLLQKANDVEFARDIMKHDDRERLVLLHALHRRGLKFLDTRDASNINNDEVSLIAAMVDEVAKRINKIPGATKVDEDTGSLLFSAVAVDDPEETPRGKMKEPEASPFSSSLSYVKTPSTPSGAGAGAYSASPITTSPFTPLNIHGMEEPHYSGFSDSVEQAAEAEQPVSSMPLGGAAEYAQEIASQEMSNASRGVGSYSSSSSGVSYLSSSSSGRSSGRSYSSTSSMWSSLTGSDDEDEDKTPKITDTSTRAAELTAEEGAALRENPDYTEVQNVERLRLLKDSDRGNLGAGTRVGIQSADLWGNSISQPKPDLKPVPEQYFNTQPDGTFTTGSEDDMQQPANLYSFLPFAKLGNRIVWIPRHVQCARFFFTSDDYEELVSHVKDMGDKLVLDKTEEVDSLLMMSTIIKTHGSLRMFCSLNPMIPASSSVEQIYAEWLEMRQIGIAVGRYQQISGGMFENMELSMRGGIRAAVSSALKPMIEMMNKQYNLGMNTNDAIPKPNSASLFGSKRKNLPGIIEPEEYNPQFAFTKPPDLKRVKFSIPTI